MLAPKQEHHREAVEPLVGGCKYIPAITKDDRKGDKFLFQSGVREFIETYLTTDLSERITAVEWRNKFSSFFRLMDSQGKEIGIIGFSIDGISIFTDGFKSRRDIQMKRDSWEYQELEKIEKESRVRGSIPPERLAFIYSLWHQSPRPES